MYTNGIIQPIMFSGGIGQIEDCLTEKAKAEKDMAVVKIGGPVYRIGVGGGAASSLQVICFQLSISNF